MNHLSIKLLWKPFGRRVQNIYFLYGEKPSVLFFALLSMKNCSPVLIQLTLPVIFTHLCSVAACSFSPDAGSWSRDIAEKSICRAGWTALLMTVNSPHSEYEWAFFTLTTSLLSSLASSTQHFFGAHKTGPYSTGNWDLRESPIYVAHIHGTPANELLVEIIVSFSDGIEICCKKHFSLM